MSEIVVIGAGQAGASLVMKLRSLGFEGGLTLIGAEPVPPYQRPPLSKGYLLGDVALERLYLRPESFYAENAIALKLGQPVEAIDPAARTVSRGDETLAYDMLALTTGSVPRRLPEAVGGGLAGVHVVRGLAEVDRMGPELAEHSRVLIVGGGYIGLEAAAVASKKGLKVILIEMGERILQRVAAPQTSDFFRELHGANGVEIREGVGLDRLTGEAGRVTGAHLTDGTDLPCDMVIAGVGIAPATSLAEQAGLAVDNGIATDEMGRTSDPHIWAAGDCASFPWRGARTRLESVQNAIDMAEAVAANMLGAEAPYEPYPWFWSDQYDVKLQIAGWGAGHDRIVTRQTDGGGVSFWYFGGEKLLAVDAMNDSRAYMVGKRLIEAGKSPDPAALTDPETDLKALLKR